MEITSAGMPFTFIYRHKDKAIIDLPLKGMPLGGFPNFEYQSQKIELNKGDTFLFHSDGLSECFNPEGLAFGESRIKTLFKKVASETPSKIIRHFNKAASEWIGKGQLRDDMTMVVMKIK
jgi:sigma-B regulation protein RsbU (phosphoserine phosphatase)